MYLVYYEFWGKRPKTRKYVRAKASIKEVKPELAFWYESMNQRVLAQTTSYTKASPEPKRVSPTAPYAGSIKRSTKKLDKNPWDDWKYRLLVEVHRRGQLSAEEASQIVGASLLKVEKHLDRLEGEGKVHQIGDSQRGIYYRPVMKA